MRVVLALLLALILWPHNANAAGFDHGGLARQMLERHIRPGYEQMFDAAQKLESTLEAFCSASPDRDLIPVREAFTQAVLAWSRIEHLRFGPIMKHARHARMVFWPDRKGLGRRQVVRALKSQDKSVTALETLQGKSVALQGFGALEYILFSKDAGVLSKPGPDRDYRCSFMRTIAANISQISGEVLKSWLDKGDYTAIFLHSGPDNPAYLEPKEVTLEIAKSFLAGLQGVRDIRLAGPLGLQRKSKRRKRAAFARSGLSTIAITANLEGLAGMYENGGVMERIGTIEAGMDKAILNELAHSLKTLRSISKPMKDAVEDPETKEQLMAIGFSLKNAYVEASRILASAAGLALGFNALDGD